MTTTLAPDATASTRSLALATATNQKSETRETATQTAAAQSSPPSLPPSDFSGSNIRHILFGTLDAVQQTIHNLHLRGYAEPNDWSPAISTGRANEVMRILVRRIPVD